MIQKSEISQGDPQIFQLRRAAVFIDTERGAGEKFEDESTP